MLRFTIDNSLTVVDNGRGIPTDIKEEFGISAAEVVMTKLHAGGKFDSKSYKVSGGLHGVGVSCVNALSESLHLEIWNKTFTWEQDYEKGIPQGPLKQTGKAGKKTGTKITFKPDATIMDATEFNFDTLAQRLRELAFLNKGLTITLTDERADPVKQHEFHYSGGIAEFIRHLNKGKAVLHEKPIYIRRRARTAERRHAQHGSGAAIQRRIFGEHFQLREQHQHRGRRVAFERLPQRADPHHQCLWAASRAVQGRERKPDAATTCAKV